MQVRQLVAFGSALTKSVLSAAWFKFLTFIGTIRFKQLAYLLVIRSIGFLIACILCTVFCVKWIRAEDRRYFWKPKARKSIPPCLISPTLGRHSYIQLKNVRLHYVENGDRKKPLMLCLHGFPEFWYCWKNQLKAFSKTHWVVAVDMRGYGDSDKPRLARNYKISLIVEDIRELIVALGKDTCVLMGHDWGGAIGWFFAATHPNLLTHYIALNCPHPVIFKEYIFSSWRQMLKSWYIYYFQTPWIPQLGLRINDVEKIEAIAASGIPADQDPTQDIEAYKYIYSRPDAWTGPVNYYRKMFSPSSWFWKKDSELRVRIPTLLIYGRNDKAFDDRVVPDCAKHVDQFQYVYVEEASHWVQRDDPKAVNTAIASFLNLKFD